MISDNNYQVEGKIRMKIGIVILNYNSYDLTTKLSDHCMNMACVDKVVIVDNNSNDNFEKYLENNSNSKIKFIQNNENLGYAAGNNLGLKYLYENGCKIGFIANPDVWFEEETIKSISEFLLKNEQYAVCSCRRSGYNNSKTRQFWWIPTKSQAIFESLHFMRSYITRKHEKKSYLICDNNSDKDYIDVEVVGGAFFGSKLSCLKNVNFLDENTFLWYEENILAYKLREKGFKEALIMGSHYQHNHIHKGHGNKKIKTYLKSKRRFCYEYLKLNWFEKIIMSLFEQIGIIEEKIICLFYK